MYLYSEALMIIAIASRQVCKGLAQTVHSVRLSSLCRAGTRHCTLSRRARVGLRFAVKGTGAQVDVTGYRWC